MYEICRKLSWKWPLSYEIFYNHSKLLYSFLHQICEIFIRSIEKNRLLQIGLQEVVHRSLFRWVSAVLYWSKQEPVVSDNVENIQFGYEYRNVRRMQYPYRKGYNISHFYCGQHFCKRSLKRTVPESESSSVKVLFFSSFQLCLCPDSIYKLFWYFLCGKVSSQSYRS